MSDSGRKKPPGQPGGLLSALRWLSPSERFVALMVLIIPLNIFAGATPLEALFVSLTLLATTPFAFWLRFVIQVHVQRYRHRGRWIGTSDFTLENRAEPNEIEAMEKSRKELEKGRVK